MKKVLSMVMCAIMVVAITLSMAGCNNTITVQDYIESDAFKTEMETLKEQFEGQGISVDVSDEMVKAVSDDSTVSVTMEYKDAAGTEIASFTYPE